MRMATMRTDRVTSVELWPLMRMWTPIRGHAGNTVFVFP